MSKRYLTNGRSRPFRVSIEGNIGSGKSTCLNQFAKYDFVETHPEPLDRWRDVNGHNLFGLLYSDLSKWNFSFQHFVQLTRLQIQTSPPLSEKIKVKMFERSVQNNIYCFADNAYRNKLLEECEFEILKAWFQQIDSTMDIDLDLIVYLRSTPEVVWHRMVKRGRNEESMVPLEYLKQIHFSYEKWLNSADQLKCPVLVIDADKDLDDVLKQLHDNTPIILNKNENGLTINKAIAL